MLNTKFNKALNMANFINNFLDSRKQNIVSGIKEVASIPAPPFKERKKIDYLAVVLRKFKFLKNIKIDKEGNLFALIPGKLNKNVLIVAHSDVALDLPKNNIFQKGNFLYGHGVCDDGAGIVAIINLLEFVCLQKVIPEYNLIILFTVGEEGLGSKRGMKYFLDKNKNIDLVINVESHNVGRITTGAIGQFRAKISVKCNEGGHSFRDYGNPNAIVLLSELICKLKDISIVKKGESSCNFGLVHGGESVNSIPKEAYVFYEFRALSIKHYNTIKKVFWLKINDFQVKPNVEVINDTPPVFLDKNHEIFKYTQKIHKMLKIKSFFKDGNTDGDIALARGIPTVTIGSSNGSNTHSADEFMKLSSLKKGYAQLLYMVLQLSDMKFLNK